MTDTNKELKAMNDMANLVRYGNYRQAAKICFNTGLTSADMIHSNESIKACNLTYLDDDGIRKPCNYFKNKYHIAIVIELSEQLNQTK
jgi:hypothetical protein